MVFAYPAAVFVEGHVQRPVQLVLDMPVLTDQGGKADQTGEVEEIVTRDLGAAVRGANRFNCDDRLDSGPFDQFSKGRDLTQHPDASSNRSPVGGVEGIEEGVRISQAEVVLDVVVKVSGDGTVGPFVIALEGDEIIALLVADLLDDGSLAPHGVDRHDTALDGQKLHLCEIDMAF